MDELDRLKKSMDDCANEIEGLREAINDVLDKSSKEEIHSFFSGKELNELLESKEYYLKHERYRIVSCIQELIDLKKTAKQS